MRCLYCDGKLPLYRKITHGQFCSTSHRKAYWQEQERLAVERLHQTHNSLKANQPPAPVESILGRDPGDAELSGHLPEVLFPQSQGARRMLAADPLAFDFEHVPSKPAWTTAEREPRSMPSGAPIRLAQLWSKGVGSRGAMGKQAVSPRGFECTPKIVPLQALRPCLQLPLLELDLPVQAASVSEPATAGPVGMALSLIAPPSCRIAFQPFPSRMPRPTQRVDLPIAPATPEIERNAVSSAETQPPLADGLLSLTGIFRRNDPVQALPLDTPRQLLGMEPLAAAPLSTRVPDHRVALAVGIPEPAGAVPSVGAHAVAMASAAAEATPKTLYVTLGLPEHRVVKTVGIRTMAGAVTLVGAQAKLPTHVSVESAPEFLQPQLTLPDYRVADAVDVPDMAGAVVLPGSKAIARQGSIRPIADAATTEPLRAMLALPARQVCLAMGTPHMAGVVALPGSKVVQSQAAHRSLQGKNVRPFAAVARLKPLLSMLALPARQPRPAMGKGSRYPIEVRGNSAPSFTADPMGFPPASLDAALSAQLASVPFAVEPSPLDALVPEARGLVSLKVSFGPPPNKPVAPILSNIATIPQPLRTETIRGSSHLEPLDAKPAADLIHPEIVGAPGSIGLKKLHPWNRVAGVWKTAPRDLKILAFAIPALLALAFHRELPKVHLATTPPSTGELSKNLRTVANTQWTSVRKAVVDRAAVALDEDFRSGLDDWASRSNATADWSFDATGFVKPGPLALYRPSMNLTDYQVQFLGMIDKKAMSWVVRAADFDNYYVLKLVVLKPGPRTTVGLTRYAVIHGKAVDRVDTVVPIEAQVDTLYRVNMDVTGDDFSLGIQGQMIDNWSEPRLPRGGVGFFTARGEESRVRWVALTHQYDMLGRLCAYLTPYETPTTNGSW
ncbi:MAG TPA: hypothetical protein VGG72_29335 [Bryobacteraceae bacterium]|jgi:hypothetical protein